MANGKNFLVSLIINARDRASGVVRGLTGSLNRLDNVVTRVGAGLAAFFGGRAIVRFFRGAIGSAQDFEAQMSRVAAATGATAEEMTQMAAEAQRMGSTTRFTATQAAEGLEILGRAGVTAADSVQLLPTVLQLAQADGLELATAAGLITDALGSMGQGVEQAGRFADVLAQGARLANTDVTSLGAALSYAGVQAAQAGQDVEATVAQLDALANAGIRGQRAGTSLRSIFAQLADPASKARKALADLGIETHDLGEVIRGLESAGASGEEAVLAFGMEAGPALRVLLQSGSQSLGEYEKELRNAAGTAQEMADAMDNNLEGALLGVSSAWDALRQKLVQPLLGKIAEEARSLASYLQDLANSQALEDFRTSLVSAFDSAKTALREFLAGFDFREAMARIGNFARGTADRLGTVVKALEVVGATARIAWSSFSAVVTGAATVITWSLSKIGEGIVRVGEHLRTLRLISSETLEGMRSTTEFLGELSDAYAAQVVQDNRNISAAWEDLTAAVTGQSRAQKAVAETAKDAGEAQRSAAEEVVEPVEAATVAYANLLEQIQAVADPKQSRAVRDNLAAMFEAGGISAEEYEQLLGKLGEQVDGLVGTTAAAAQQLNGINLAAGLTKSAEEAEKAFEELKGTISDAADSGDIKQLEVAFRGMFLTGEIGAKDFDEAMKGLKERQGEIREEAEETKKSLGSIFDDFNEALKQASSRGDVTSIMRQVDEAWRAGELSAEEYTKAAELAEAATEAVGRAASGNPIQGIWARATERVKALSDATFEYMQRLQGVRGASKPVDELAASIASVTAELRRAEETHRAAMGDMQKWGSEIAIAGHKAELAYYKQAQALQGLIERIEQGRMSTGELDAAARHAAHAFDLLEEQDLSGLTSAIRTARSEVESLTRGIAEQVSSLQDELARLRGDEEAIEERQFERRRQQLRELQREASEAGEAEAAAEANRALRLLEDVREETARQRRREAEERREQERQQAPGAPAAGAVAAARPTNLGTVTFELPGGQSVDVLAEPDSAEQLLRTLREAGLRSI